MTSSFSPPIAVTDSGTSLSFSVFFWAVTRTSETSGAVASAARAAAGASTTRPAARIRAGRAARLNQDPRMVSTPFLAEYRAI